MASLGAPAPAALGAPVGLGAPAPAALGAPVLGAPAPAGSGLAGTDRAPACR